MHYLSWRAEELKTCVRLPSATIIPVTLPESGRGGLERCGTAAGRVLGFPAVGAIALVELAAEMAIHKPLYTFLHCLLAASNCSQVPRSSVFTRFSINNSESKSKTWSKTWNRALYTKLPVRLRRRTRREAWVALTPTPGLFLVYRSVLLNRGVILSIALFGQKDPSCDDVLQIPLRTKEIDGVGQKKNPGPKKPDHAEWVANRRNTDHGPDDDSTDTVLTLPVPLPLPGGWSRKPPGDDAPLFSANLANLEARNFTCTFLPRTIPAVKNRLRPKGDSFPIFRLINRRAAPATTVSTFVLAFPCDTEQSHAEFKLSKCISNSLAIFLWKICNLQIRRRACPSSDYINRSVAKQNHTSLGRKLLAFPRFGPTPHPIYAINLKQQESKSPTRSPVRANQIISALGAGGFPGGQAPQEYCTLQSRDSQRGILQKFEPPRKLPTGYEATRPKKPTGRFAAISRCGNGSLGMKALSSPSGDCERVLASCEVDSDPRAELGVFVSLSPSKLQVLDTTWCGSACGVAPLIPSPVPLPPFFTAASPRFFNIAMFMSERTLTPPKDPDLSYHRRRDVAAVDLSVYCDPLFIMGNFHGDLSTSLSRFAPLVVQILSQSSESKRAQGTQNPSQGQNTDQSLGNPESVSLACGCCASLAAIGETFDISGGRERRLEYRFSVRLQPTGLHRLLGASVRVFLESLNVNVNGSHFRRVYTTICVSSRSMLSTVYLRFPPSSVVRKLWEWLKPGKVKVKRAMGGSGLGFWRRRLSSPHGERQLNTGGVILCIALWGPRHVQSQVSRVGRDPWIYACILFRSSLGLPAPPSPILLVVCGPRDTNIGRVDRGRDGMVQTLDDKHLALQTREKQRRNRTWPSLYLQNAPCTLHPPSTHLELPVVSPLPIFGIPQSTSVSSSSFRRSTLSITMAQKSNSTLVDLFNGDGEAEQRVMPTQSAVLLNVSFDLILGLFVQFFVEKAVKCNRAGWRRWRQRGQALFHNRKMRDSIGQWPLRLFPLATLASHLIAVPSYGVVVVVVVVIISALHCIASMIRTSTDAIRSRVVERNASLSKPLSLQVLAPFAPPLPARRPLYPHPDLHLLQLPCKRSEKSPTPPQPKEEGKLNACPLRSSSGSLAPPRRRRVAPANGIGHVRTVLRTRTGQPPNQAGLTIAALCANGHASAHPRHRDRLPLSSIATASQQAPHEAMRDGVHALKCVYSSRPSPFATLAHSGKRGHEEREIPKASQLGAITPPGLVQPNNLELSLPSVHFFSLFCCSPVAPIRRLGKL
ncbi:uncharacterized protein CLUP02_07813 [Colletotrichum lupini]|uniref:Uncharacterized protein n=1 Tax=Colletotrichum lupini TaxID=145971 RepID=A0A9Q8WGF2_9PEZI|nr:uncharacterized protein CLUP02_07813 [Colletotrichum lupini]UQC82326.1 hypothetical protein CLUP02_07813 [Colletotrichum lupini]